MPSDAKRGETFRVAFACDEEGRCGRSHFGDAQAYEIHACGVDAVTFVERIPNPKKADDEDEHDSKEKAHCIRDLLKERDVVMVASRRFGPNVLRMRKAFLIAVVESPDVASALEQLRERAGEILAGIARGETAERPRLLLAVGDGADKASARVVPMACRGCRRCVTACPVEAIRMDAAKAVVDPLVCVACGTCVASCRPGAIELVNV